MDIYYYNYQRDEMLTRAQQLERQYKSGRVAFRMTHHTIGIRDLRSGNFTTVMHEERSACGKWVLGDRYLVSLNVPRQVVVSFSPDQRLYLSSCHPLEHSISISQLCPSFFFSFPL